MQSHITSCSRIEPLSWIAIVEVKVELSPSIGFRFIIQSFLEHCCARIVIFCRSNHIEAQRKDYPAVDLCYHHGTRFTLVV